MLIKFEQLEDEGSLMYTRVYTQTSLETEHSYTSKYV